jgi:proliferating cell nuclear antigen
MSAATSHYLFEAKTVKSALIKQSFEALKDFITEGNLIFDETGVKLLEMDTSHVVLAHMQLNAKDFETYHCCSGKSYECGIHLLNFNKIMKMISNDDILTFYQDADETNELGIIIENSNDHRVKNIKFKLLDLNKSNIAIPPTAFSSVINIPSAMFQKICRDFSVLSETIEIKSVQNKLIFGCDGQICRIEEVITENSNSMNIIDSENADEIIQGVFSIKHLVSFTKCSNLCNTIELYLKNNFPVIIKYSIGSIGTLMLCLAPKENDI